MKKLPSDVLEFFKAQAARGGRIGGKRSLETMPVEERALRAKKGHQRGCAGEEGEGSEPRNMSANGLRQVAVRLDDGL